MTRTRLVQHLAPIPLAMVIALLSSPVLAQTQTVASSESTTYGTVSGNYSDTHANDGFPETLTEVESGGKPANRHSRLEHTWTFDLSTGTSTSFSVKAYHIPEADGDDIEFRWSTDGSSFQSLLTVNDTDDYQTAPLAGLSGTVYIQVRDTDRSSGNRELDTVHVDHMYIESVTSGGPPLAPTDAAALSFTSTTVHFGWVDNSDNEDGFVVERSLDGMPPWESVPIGTDEVLFVDTTVTASTTLYYRVAAFNSFGPAYSDVAVVTTRDVGGYTSEIVSQASWVDGQRVGGHSHDFLPGQVGIAIQIRAQEVIDFASADPVTLNWSFDPDIYPDWLNPGVTEILFAYSPSGIPSMVFGTSDPGARGSPQRAQQLIFGQWIAGEWTWEIVDQVAAGTEDYDEFESYSLAFRPSDGKPAIAYRFDDEPRTVGVKIDVA